MDLGRSDLHGRGRGVPHSVRDDPLFLQMRASPSPRFTDKTRTKAPSDDGSYEAY